LREYGLEAYNEKAANGLGSRREIGKIHLRAFRRTRSATGSGPSFRFLVISHKLRASGPHPKGVQISPPRPFLAGSRIVLHFPGISRALDQRDFLVAAKEDDLTETAVVIYPARRWHSSGETKVPHDGGGGRC
jgi:hypothetical protein